MLDSDKLKLPKASVCLRVLTVLTVLAVLYTLYLA